MATTKVTRSVITSDAISGAEIADDAIDSEHYAAGSIDTAHIADNQITLAKMAGGTDGQIITYDASGDPVAVGPGSDGQVLTSTGAGSPPAFEDAAGGGAWTKITSTAGSNVSAIDFTSGITNTYSMYVFVISNIGRDGGGSKVGIRISNDGGSSYKSDNLYYGAVFGRDSDNSTSELSKNGISEIELSRQDVDDECFGAIIYMNDPANTTYTTSFWGTSTTVNANANVWNHHMIGGSYDDASTKLVNGVRFFNLTGNNFGATGRITLYGISHS